MHRRVVIALGLLAAGVAAWCIAGPLDPPSGPVAPTYKTLNDVEPRIPISAATTPGDANSTFKITSPGSYYLTGNVTGEANKFGIKVDADSVTIDLMGFELAGVPGSYSGIRTEFGMSRLQVRNGSVRRWGGEGINAEGARGCIFDNLRLSLNESGIRTGSAAVVTDSTATNNTYFGFTSDASIIRGCTATHNGTFGISMSSSGVIEQCHASFNGEHGISTLYRTTVSNCNSMSNGAAGIFAQNACVVKDCTASNNTSDGIRAHSGGLVSGNACYQNGSGAGDGAGIALIGNGTRVEDNNVFENDRGIDVEYANNFIVRNTARANAGGNYTVAAGNEFAPVITNPGTTFTNATPWSNFAY